jgi:hypothetical protein
MRVKIGWTEEQIQAVLVAIGQGTVPVLDPGVAARIGSAAEQRPLNGDPEPYWLVDLDFPEGQVLKQWCDDRRDRETESENVMRWTRIVAKVNEAVQVAAPAKQ